MYPYVINHVNNQYINVHKTIKHRSTKNRDTLVYSLEINFYVSKLFIVIGI